MDKLNKASEVLSIGDIILCAFTLAISFMFPFLVNNPSCRILFSSGFMYWTVIVSLVLSLIAIVLFVTVSIIRAIYHKKIIVDKCIILTHIVNLIFFASLIFFIYDHDLGLIFA